MLRLASLLLACSTTATISSAAAQDCSVPDLFEVNNTCTGALSITDGDFIGLNVQGTDSDFYSLTVADGNAVYIEATFDASLGAVDLYLWDPLIGCDSTVVGSTGPAVATGMALPGGAFILYTNASGVDRDLILEVSMAAQQGCNEYSLFIQGIVGDTPCGTSFCTANPNSTGAASRICASGSDVIADNDLTLTAEDLPDNATCLFIASSQTGFVPGPAGSAGNLCLVGNIGRYVGAGQILNSGPTGGTVSLMIDTTMIPQPSGFATTAPGQTWHFQLWHRDVDSFGQVTSNFSEGTTILFR